MDMENLKYNENIYSVFLVLEVLFKIIVIHIYCFNFLFQKLF